MRDQELRIIALRCAATVHVTTRTNGLLLANVLSEFCTAKEDPDLAVECCKIALELGSPPKSEESYLQRVDNLYRFARFQTGEVGKEEPKAQLKVAVPKRKGKRTARAKKPESK